MFLLNVGLIFQFHPYIIAPDILSCLLRDFIVEKLFTLVFGELSSSGGTIIEKHRVFGFSEYLISYFQRIATLCVNMLET